MDSEDDNEDLEVINEGIFQRSTSERKRFFERFLPKQTIIYMQYCLLRIPFLLIYDYLYSDQFYFLIQSFLQYSIDIIDQENQILFKPISLILRSYFFHLLIHINFVFSIPILGRNLFELN
jgi:hypothetical protein